MDLDMIQITVSKASKSKQTTILATGRGFDVSFLFTKGNGKGFWQWEGVLCFMAFGKCNGKVF